MLEETKDWEHMKSGTWEMTDCTSIVLTSSQDDPPKATDATGGTECESSLARLLSQ